MTAIPDPPVPQPKAAPPGPQPGGAPGILAMAATGLLIPLIGALDYMTGRDFTFALIYLVPVAAAAWLSGRRLAISFSVLVALTWLATDYLAGRFAGGPLAYAWNFSSRLIALLIIALLVARLRRALQHEREMSRTDGLTGAMNARAFRELADAEIGRSRRSGRPVTLAYIDIDGFKRVNDTLGHAAGDRLLRAAVETLTKNVRRLDGVARLGGDEFALLLPETGEQGARRAVDKIRAALAQVVAQGKWPVAFSIGVLTCAEAPPDVETMLDLADRLMYSAKSGGGDEAVYATYPQA